MADIHPRSAASVGGVPLQAVLAPVPVVSFLVAWLADIVYAKTAEMMWADMAVWLLTIGLVVALPAVVAGLVDFLGDRRVRAIRAAWVYGLSAGLALALSILNVFVHSRDAYTSVVPLGLTLSTVVAAILVVTVWSGLQLVFRHGVGVLVGEA